MIVQLLWLWNPSWSTRLSEPVIDFRSAETGWDASRTSNAVPYVRENFFRGEDWLGLEHVQTRVITWCL